MDRGEQFAHAGAVLGRDGHLLRPRAERELAVEQRTRLVALVLALPVPLVDRDDQCTAGLEHVPEHGGVLFGHALPGVEHHHGYFAVLDGLQRLEHAELLDGLLDLRAASQAGGVHQPVALAVALQVDGDRIAGGARHLGSDDALLA